MVGQKRLPKIYRSSILGLNIGPVIITDYDTGWYFLLYHKFYLNQGMSLGLGPKIRNPK